MVSPFLVNLLISSRKFDQPLPSIFIPLPSTTHRLQPTFNQYLKNCALITPSWRHVSTFSSNVPSFEKVMLLLPKTLLS